MFNPSKPLQSKYPGGTKHPPTRITQHARARPISQAKTHTTLRSPCPNCSSTCISGTPTTPSPPPPTSDLAAATRGTTAGAGRLPPESIPRGPVRPNHLLISFLAAAFHRGRDMPASASPPAQSAAPPPPPPPASPAPLVSPAASCFLF